MKVGGLLVTFMEGGGIWASLVAQDSDGTPHAVAVELQPGMPNEARLYLDDVIQDPHATFGPAEDGNPTP